MPAISRFYFGMAILFLMTGITLGLAMAISQDHSLAPVHAHINLLGWVTSAIFGGYYALNPLKAEGWLPRIQCAVYTIGLVVMLPALYYLYAGHPEIEPALGAGSMATALGVVLFAAVVFTRGRSAAARLQPAE